MDEQELKTRTPSPDEGGSDHPAPTMVLNDSLGSSSERITEKSPLNSPTDEFSGDFRSFLQNPGNFYRWFRTNHVAMLLLAWVVLAFGVTLALIAECLIGIDAVYQQGVVASDIAECSDIGADILDNSGTVVDAAIATVFCMGVMNSISSGIGGGSFLIVYVNDEVSVIDFRSVAPSAATSDMYDDDLTKASYGALSVAVPGELRGLELAHQLYGSKSWSELIQPSIDLATNGFAVTEYLADKLVTLNTSLLSSDLMDIYYPGGVALVEGDILTLPALAETLQIIADEGADALYNGSLTDGFVEYIQSEGGIITTDDMADYSAIQKDPISIDFLGYTVYGVPPPAGGAVVMSILNILSGYTEIINGEAISDVFYQRLVEAFKFAYGQRTYLADPDFVNVTLILDEMLSSDIGTEIRDRITDNSTHEISYYLDIVSSLLSDSGTATVTVQDLLADMAVITTSVNTYFGSGMITPSGIVLNNDMDDFTIPGIDDVDEYPQLENNEIEPGKRPLSSMSPTLVFNPSDLCDRTLAMGGNNGTAIITGVTQVLLDIVVWGETAKKAIQTARLHHELIPDILYAEADMSADVLTYLEDIGHVIEIIVDNDLSIVHAVVKEEDVLTGFADERKGGSGTTIF